MPTVSEILKSLNESEDAQLNQQLDLSRTMWAIRRHSTDTDLVGFEDADRLREAIRQAYDEGFRDAAKTGALSKVSALVAAWCEGAKFALHAIAKHDLCFLTDAMKLSAVNLATDACITERDRLNGGLPLERDGNEDDPILLHAEIHRLRSELKGPDSFATWKDAAIAERLRRVKAEEQLRELLAVPQAAQAVMPAWRRLPADTHLIARQMHKEFDEKYGDMSGVMRAVNAYRNVVERFRRPFNSDMDDPVTNSDVDAAEAEMLRNIRTEAYWIVGQKPVSLDALAEAVGTMDLGRATADAKSAIAALEAEREVTREQLTTPLCAAPAQAATAEITDTERLDFTVSAETTWYPGRARNGSGAGILCYAYKGRRAEAEGLTIRDALDAAIRATRGKSA